MKTKEQWTAVDYWNDLQKGDLEVETYIRVGDDLAEYAALLEVENATLKRENEAARDYIVNLESGQPFPNKYRDAWVKARRGDTLLTEQE